MAKELVNAVCEVYGIEKYRLLSRSKVGKLPEARRMVTYILHQQNMHPELIAKQINRDRTLCYTHIKQMRFELKYYPCLQQKHQEIINTMRRNLEQEKEQLENWLKNNPEGDWKVRYDKLERLQEIENQLKLY